MQAAREPPGRAVVFAGARHSPRANHVGRSMGAMTRRPPARPLRPNTALAAIVLALAFLSAADPARAEGVPGYLATGAIWPTVTALPRRSGPSAVDRHARRIIASHADRVPAPAPPGLPLHPRLSVTAEHGPRTPSDGLQGMIRFHFRF